MKKVLRFACIISIIMIIPGNLFASTIIPANDPNIQYYGRWDFSNPAAPSHSWPGVYIISRFEGTSIGVRMSDNFCYYDIFIDGILDSKFHPNTSGITSYTLKTGLSDGEHTILIAKRNETNWTEFSFNGFILDDGKSLLPAGERASKKIEFIGDSFTCASGNEATTTEAPPDVDFYTNMDEGFPAIVGKHYNAQYYVTGRSGYGMVMDYTGNYTGNIPESFDRALCYTDLPKWDFEQWVPNLVVICLGLNDYNGFGGYSGPVSQEKKDLFKQRYHDFIATVRDVYPGVKILAVAAQVPWIQTTVFEIVEEENGSGHDDINYTYFPSYEGGYVNNGHPNVATHHKIADRIIAAIDGMNAWEPYVDNNPPAFTKYPHSNFTVYDTTYLLKVSTDSYSTVKLSTENKPYQDMETVFTETGKRDHSVEIPCEHGRHYDIYIKAADLNGNVQENPLIVSFDVDTTKVLLNWKSLAFNDSGWKENIAPLGNDNSSSIKTQLAGVTTSYFRKIITIDDLSALAGFGLLIKGQDAATVYINGIEAGRLNFFEDSVITYHTLAIEPMPLNKVFVFNTPEVLSAFKNGENIIAIEVHAAEEDNPTISFDSRFFDSKNKSYYTLGSSWKYQDDGETPSDQLVDKVTEVLEYSSMVPEKSVLYENYPNPFNPDTNLEFQISAAADGSDSRHGGQVGLVSLKVYDLLGNEVATLINKEMPTGKYKVNFNAGNLASGVYFYELRAGSFVAAKKMMLVK